VAVKSLSFEGMYGRNSGIPMKHKQVMFMESANGQANATMGMIPSICFSVEEVSLYCLVQVVRNAPFECLLGLPFTSLASTKCQEFPDGSHISCSLIQTRGPPLQFQFMLRSPQSLFHSPCSHKEDFNC